MGDRKVRNFAKRAEAIRQANNAYALDCQMLGRGNVIFDVDMKNRRCTITTPSMDGSKDVTHFVWEEEVW